MLMLLPLRLWTLCLRWWPGIPVQQTPAYDYQKKIDLFCFHSLNVGFCCLYLLLSLFTLCFPCTFLCPWSIFRFVMAWYYGCWKISQIIVASRYPRIDSRAARTCGNKSCYVHPTKTIFKASVCQILSPFWCICCVSYLLFFSPD